MPTLADLRQFVSSQFWGTTILPNADLSGKTVIITGANTGLGFEAAKHIARMRVSTLILACRSLDKGNAAAKQIQLVSDSVKVEVWQLDLDDDSSISSFCNRTRTTLDRLDGVILNAGVELIDFERSSNGLERTINVNVVGTMMLATGLLPKLDATARNTHGETNMTFVGSLIHIFGGDSEFEAKGDDTILEHLSTENTANMGGRYPLSKLAIHQCFNEFVQEYNARDKNIDSRVTINLVNPGWCSSELARARPKAIPERIMFSLVGRTAEEGSRTLVHGVVAGRETHGQYLSECQAKEQSAYVRSERGRATQKRLWQDVSGRIRKAGIVS